MSGHSPLGRLTVELAVLSSISFGGIPSVLPDIHHFVVDANGWLTHQEFTNIFAISQAIPGPNMILMTGLIGWKIAGIGGAVSAACATFAPPCTMYFCAYRLWDRFRAAPWQRIARRGLAPVTIGLVIAGGSVMAQTADATGIAFAVTAAAAAALFLTRLNPLWLLGVGAGLGGLGLL